MPKHLCTQFLLTLVSLSAVASAAAPPNLAGYWPLDDATGSTQATDQTLTSNGVPSGNPVFGFAGVGTGSLAVDFDGSGDFLAIPHHDNYLLDSGTVVFWFKTDALGARKGLLSKDSTDFDTGGHITVFLESNDKISVHLQSTTTSYTIYTASTVQADQWHHVAVVFGVGGMELYLDGSLEGTNAYAGGMGTTSGGTGNYEPIVLGASSWASTDLLATPVQDYFNGLIDEVGIINERWDSSTIADLFVQTGPGTSVNLGDFAGPSVFYVRTRGSDANDGLTPQTSFRTIQKAINNCTRPGTTVYIGPGTYQESIEIGMGAGVAAVSGTASLQTRLIADITGVNTFDDPGEVLIDGQSVNANGITILSRNYWAIQGFTLRGQQAYGIYGTNTGLNITNCTFGVPASFAVYTTITSDTTIADCIFDRSVASGSSIWVQTINQSTQASIVITRNDLTMKGDLYDSVGYNNGFTYVNNIPGVNRYIYGIIVLAWNASVDQVEISNNQVSDYYLPILSLVSTAGSGAIIANNTVTNSLYSIYNYTFRSGSSITINNIVDTCYYGIFAPNYQGGTATVVANLEHNITASMAPFNREFEFDIIQGSPRFTDAAAGDFSLQLGSPAIDAGTITGAPSTDIDRRSRPADGDDDGVAQVDLGAYELVTPRQQIKVVQWREIGIDADR